MNFNIYIRFGSAFLNTNWNWKCHFCVMKHVWKCFNNVTLENHRFVLNRMKKYKSGRMVISICCSVLQFQIITKYASARCFFESTAILNAIVWEVWWLSVLSWRLPLAFKMNCLQSFRVYYSWIFLPLQLSCWATDSTFSRNWFQELASYTQPLFLTLLSNFFFSGF